MKVVKKNTKYKKNKMAMPLFVVLFAVLAISGALLVYIYTQNYINIEYIDKAGSKIEEENVTNVSPIIINNLVVGGITDNGKWVNKEITTKKANILKGTELDLYNAKGKMGTFEIYSSSHNMEKNLSYVMPLTDIKNEEYIAVNKKDTNIMVRSLTKIEPSEKDKKSVKKALGKYRLFNNTVKVNEVYEVYLENGQKTRLVSATSSGKNTFGVYSVIVAVTPNKYTIVKYSYVKNTESSINWPIYSIKFACDLNNDDKYELVIQEARELTMKYSILENRENKYYEVIGLEFKV